MSACPSPPLGAARQPKGFCGPGQSSNKNICKKPTFQAGFRIIPKLTQSELRHDFIRGLKVGGDALNVIIILQSINQLHQALHVF